MANLNNPAGRLYEYLSAFHRAAEHGKPVRSIWSEVLGIGANDPVLYRRLGEIAGLLGDVARAVAEVDDAIHWEVVEYNTIKWAQPLFPAGVAYTQQPSSANKMLGNDTLQALGSLASYLAAVAPEGRDVPEEERRTLSQRLEAIKAEIADDEDIDPKLRATLLRRLHDIWLALDTYKVTGPRGLRDALEVLGAAIVFEERERGEGRVPEKVKTFLKDAYNATQAVATIYGAVDAGVAIAGLLT